MQIKAFGLNRMDILQREGRYPVPAGASQILGVEFSGTVAELGAEATQWKINDEVFGITSGVCIQGTLPFDFFFCQSIHSLYSGCICGIY